MLQLQSALHQSYFCSLQTPVPKCASQIASLGRLGSRISFLYCFLLLMPTSWRGPFSSLFHFLFQKILHEKPASIDLLWPCVFSIDISVLHLLMSTSDPMSLYMAVKLRKCCVPYPWPLLLLLVSPDLRQRQLKQWSFPVAFCRCKMKRR